MICGAFLKMLIPVLVVFPGLIALGLFPGIEDSDRAFATMIKSLLPPGMTGLLFAAFFAALMSSIDSTLNSAATLWTKDIYQRFIRTDASDQHYLVVGRLFTGILMLFAIISSPISAKFPGIYIYIQTLLSFIQGPILAVLVLGMFWTRTTQWGGLAGLTGGMCLSGIMYFFKADLFTIEEPFLYISWWSFLGALILCFSVSLLTEREPQAKLRGLVYGLVLRDQELQEMFKNKISKN